MKLMSVCLKLFIALDAHNAIEIYLILSFVQMCRETSGRRRLNYNVETDAVKDING